MKAEYKDGILRLSFGDLLHIVEPWCWTSRGNSKHWNPIVAKSRKLKCKWPADYHQELHFYYGIK